MFELKITASNPHELGMMLADMAKPFGIMDTLIRARQMQQDAGVTKEAVAASVADAVREQVPAEPVEPPKRRARKAAEAQPTIEGLQAAQAEVKAKPAKQPDPAVEEDPLDVPSFLKKDKPAPTIEAKAIDVPKNYDEARALIVKVMDKHGEQSGLKILEDMGVKQFRNIPIENYGKLAEICAKAMES